MENFNTIALGFIIVGSFLSLGRDFLAKFCLNIFIFLKKKPADKRLLLIFQTYLMFTGMFFTIIGLLGLLGVLKY